MLDCNYLAPYLLCFLCTYHNITVPHPTPTQLSPRYVNILVKWFIWEFSQCHPQEELSPRAADAISTLASPASEAHVSGSWGLLHNHPGHFFHLSFTRVPLLGPKVFLFPGLLACFDQARPVIASWDRLHMKQTFLTTCTSKTMFIHIWISAGLRVRYISLDIYIYICISRYIHTRYNFTWKLWKHVLLLISSIAMEKLETLLILEPLYET